MKKLTGALVLSFSLLLASSCRSAGETKDPVDASTPASEGGMDTSKGALSGSGGTSGGTAQPASDSGTGTPAGSDPAMANPSGTGTSGGTAATPMSEEARAAQEACVDKWLNGKKMDRYGHPEGTMYTGGSPLFNEATGESKDRMEYVFSRQPEAKKACPSTPAPK